MRARSVPLLRVKISPMNDRSRRHRSDLHEIARRAMREKGLTPDFPKSALEQLDGIREPAPPKGDGVRDMRSLLWASIDNDDSRDLDQLSVAEALPNGEIKVFVAIADVDALVRKGTPLDERAAHNTTSVYTAGGVFPMLPEKLSTDLTSLNPDEDRARGGDRVRRGRRRRAARHGRLSRASCATRRSSRTTGWTRGATVAGRCPRRWRRSPGIDAQMRLQETAAQKLRARRYEEGALDLETIEARAVFDGETITGLTVDQQNEPRQLIEDFMIAANGVTARFLEEKRYPSLRRVVRSPERWLRIVTVAVRARVHAAARARREGPRDVPEGAAAARIPSASPISRSSIVKLMGAGEYVLELPGQPPIGHFGLAVRDYTHSTAPNRRYPDVITQRLLKAALAGRPSPYANGELASLARHCTEQEDAANKVERLVRKSAAALLLQNRVGERFDGVVTGASEKGTWARIFAPPVEGKIVRGEEGLEVGDKVRVKLLSTDVERGFIDFARS